MLYNCIVKSTLHFVDATAITVPYWTIGLESNRLVKVIKGFDKISHFEVGDAPHVEGDRKPRI